MEKIVRVMIVEDHELLREGLVLMVARASDFEVVAQVPSAEEALEALEESRPDLLLLDLKLPGMSGSELCRRVRALAPHVRIVVLTGVEDLALILEAVQAGACAYLPKDIGPTELVENLRRVRDEGTLLEPFLARRLLAELTRRKGAEAAPARAVSLSGPGNLSAREVEILKRVVAGQSNREIADQLAISGFTVANHLKNVYRKLGVRDRTQAVLTALNRGLLALVLGLVANGL